MFMLRPIFLTKSNYEQPFQPGQVAHHVDCQYLSHCIMICEQADVFTVWLAEDLSEITGLTMFEMRSICVRHVVCKCGTCVWHAFNICWTCVGHVLDMHWKCVGHSMQDMVMPGHKLE